MREDELLQRITVNPEIFGGKPIVRGRRIAVEHILGMLAAGDDFDTLLEGIPGLSGKTSWPASSTLTDWFSTNGSSRYRSLPRLEASA